MNWFGNNNVSGFCCPHHGMQHLAHIITLCPGFPLPGQDSWGSSCPHGSEFKDVVCGDGPWGEQENKRKQTPPLPCHLSSLSLTFCFARLHLNLLLQSIKGTLYAKDYLTLNSHKRKECPSVDVNVDINKAACEVMIVYLKSKPSVVISHPFGAQQRSVRA